MRILPLLLPLLLFPTLSVPAQTPAWSTYGTGCAQWIAPDQILNQRLDPVTSKIIWNLPRIGGEFGVMINRQFSVGIYDCASLLFIGPSNTRYLGLKLPLTVPLDIQGRNWGPCLLTAIQAVLPGRRFCYGSGCWELSLPIPNDTALLGVSVYMQWAVLYEKFGNASCTLLRYSDGGHALIGR